MIRLTTLGATDLRDRLGKPVRDVLAQPKRAALLVYLAVEGRRAPVTRDRLLAMFWPESDESRARNTLSQALHHLRQALGPGVVESEGLHALGIAGERLWCDAVQFAESIERGDAELALDLYRGEFCPTLFVSGAPEVEDWIERQRQRLRGLAQATALTLAERLAGRGETEAATRAARRALALRPEDEGDVRALLSLLERSGDGAGALLAYQEYAKRLATELETEPAPETRQLVEAIRRRREAPPAPAGTGGADAAGTQSEGAIAAAAPGVRPHLDTAQAPAPSRRRWSRGSPLLLAGAALALVATVVVATRPWGRPAPPPKALAVLPFAVRGSPSLAYLREGMVDLLSAKLEGAAGIRVLDPHAVLAAMRGRDAAAGPQGAAQAARAVGATWYVTGDVVESAGRVQVVGSLSDAGGGAPAIAIASVTGDTSALFQLVDDLTGRLLAGLSRGRDTALTSLAAVTTRSLPALKAFLAGEQALRLGLDAQAAASFREAALADTTFALAQYRLSVAATWVTVRDAEDPTVWAERATRHADHLSPLGRDLLTAYRAYRETRAEDAERLYRSVVEGHPDNVEAWLMLGETRFHFNPWRGRAPMEAWTAFQRVLELDSTNAHAIIHLARLAASEGRVATLDSLARRYLDRFPDAERALEVRALQADVHDDAVSRALVAAATRRANDFVAVGVLQAASVYAQNLDAAAELAPAFAGPPGQPALFATQVGRRMLSELAVAGGRWRWGDAEGTAPEDAWVLEVKALAASDPLFPLERTTVAAVRDSILARRRWSRFSALATPDSSLGAEMRTYLLGLLSVRLGDAAGAARYADELAAVRDARRAWPAQQLARGLRAEAARSAGDPRRALAELEGFAFESPAIRAAGFAHWGVRERFLRAELLHALGRDQEALGWYDSFLNSYDLPYLAAAHLRRAEIYERLGNREQARFHYGRFVKLWKDCDPAFRPMVARAEVALARLGGASE